MKKKTKEKRQDIVFIITLTIIAGFLVNIWSALLLDTVVYQTGKFWQVHPFLVSVFIWSTAIFQAFLSFFIKDFRNGNKLDTEFRKRFELYLAENFWFTKIVNAFTLWCIFIVLWAVWSIILLAILSTGSWAWFVGFICITVIYKCLRKETFKKKESRKKNMSTTDYLKKSSQVIAIVSAIENNIAIAKVIHTKKDNNIETSSLENQLMVYLENNAVCQVISSVHNLLHPTSGEFKVLDVVKSKTQDRDISVNENIYRKYKKYYMENYPDIQPLSQEYLGKDIEIGGNMNMCSSVYYQSGDLEKDINMLRGRWDKGDFNTLRHKFVAHKDADHDIPEIAINIYGRSPILTDKGINDLKVIVSDISKHLRFAFYHRESFDNLEQETEDLVAHMNKKEQLNERLGEYPL